MRPACFNPSPVCGTGEIRDAQGNRLFSEFQSVSGLWDRRNDGRQRVHPKRPGFNPSPVCGTGEIQDAAIERAAAKFQSVSGLWDRRNDINLRMQSNSFQFQSVSGLWDRRNAGGRGRIGGACRFNPSPVCGTGEMGQRGCWFHRPSVSIRLRSVGPEKFVDAAHREATGLFQSVSGLWDRRNGSDGQEVRGQAVSIRLRSVGPEKCRAGRRRRAGAYGFNPSPVCGTGEISFAAVCNVLKKFQSVSGLWDRRNAAGP